MNIIDKKFFDLADEIRRTGETELYLKIKSSFDTLPAATKKSLATFFSQYGYWGGRAPAGGVYE